MIKNSWTFDGKSGIGYEIINKEGEVDKFYCFGNSEEIEAAVKEIQKFNEGKEYSFDWPSKETFGEEKWKEYTIHAQELKKALWEVGKKYRCLDEPIEPIRSIKLFRKGNKNKMKEYERKLEKYRRKWLEHAKKLENQPEKAWFLNQQLSEKTNDSKMSEGMKSFLLISGTSLVWLTGILIYFWKINKKRKN